MSAVTIPRETLMGLFASANWGARSGTSLDFARNAIEHTAAELRLLGNAAVGDGGPTSTTGPEDVYQRCHALSSQLQSVLAIVSRMEGTEPESEADK